MEISDVLENKFLRNHLITAVCKRAVDIEILVDDFSQRIVRFMRFYRNALITEFFRELGNIPKRFVDIVGREFHCILI